MVGEILKIADSSILGNRERTFDSKYSCFIAIIFNHFLLPPVDS